MSITVKAKANYKVLDINRYIADICYGLGMHKTDRNTEKETF